MELLLEKMRTINWLLQKTGEGSTSFDEWCEAFNSMMDSDIYIINRLGQILGTYCSCESSIETDYGEDSFISEDINEKFMNVEETLSNIKYEDACERFACERIKCGNNSMIIPIFGGGRREGTLIFSKDKEFETEDIILGECGAAVMGIDIERKQNRVIEEKLRKKAVVQIAVGTLSLTEIEAVKEIFREMNSDEGLVVAEKIGKKTGINKSVIMNGLRKLENAGVIESKTLGMKGTHIRIVNDQLKRELERI